MEDPRAAERPLEDPDQPPLPAATLGEVETLMHRAKEKGLLVSYKTMAETVEFRLEVGVSALRHLMSHAEALDMLRIVLGKLDLPKPLGAGGLGTSGVAPPEA